MSADPELSVVVPLYNEAAVVPRLVEVVVGVLEALGRPFELVLVDDGSGDGTADVIDRLAATDPRIAPVVLSRNFGKEAALAAGLDAARGAAVVLMDGDLQHPPEVIPELVARWDAGAHVVHGVKEHRGDESAAYRAASGVFNGLMSTAIGRDFSRESDFKLLDRVAVDAVCALPERVRFFRGLVAWVGFQTDEVPFRVADRVGGDTSWSTWSLARYAVRNLVAFTSLPLRIIAGVGFAVTGFGVLLSLLTLYNWANGTAVDGFTTTIIAVLVVGGANLLSLGVVSLYVAVVYEELKARPVYVAHPDVAPAAEAAPAGVEAPAEALVSG
jgi:dolichol-phosphate mannosyltransferase